MKTIMLVCAAGMSTSLLVTKMEKAAEAQGIEAKIFALSASEADPEIEKGEIDVILLGPQVRFMLKQFEEKAASINVPVEVINMQDYGMMNGEKVFATALKLIEEGA
ncbi:PTS sugar transporter subunit IIB [Enterococcus sp.]|uniref:PTS sugar transporter subunit IIB n=1 Tax=Enterococcus sp. TaxID=35783 RepID=UPI00290F942C|nr:PTS sugar transporter subunit IIB [Enterococcus sp.]MDU5336742.1 PTS sugar transporter subunit IIB [Enterococcus sp.]